MTRLAAALYTAPILLVLFSGAASARQQNGLAFLHATPSSPIRHYPNIPSSMFSSTIDEIPSDAPIDTSSSGSGDPEGVLQARNRLIALSKALTSNSPTGKFITRPSSTKKFQQAIADLEAVASSTTSSSREKELLLGDWKLIATANVPSSDIRRRITEKQNSNNSSSSDKKKSWFNMPQARSGLSSDNSSSLNPIQKSIQKSFQVTQRIRNDGAEDEEINRVDNVIEFTPLDSLDDIFPKESPLSNIFGQINVNPLQVKKGKVVLIHKAEVESVSPILRTKIAWTSSVLNVAGTSQYFDESGSDIFGVNNLLGEFLSVGSFDTPFVDEDVRVSRSTSGPILEQLRVFVRVGSNILDEGMLDSLTAEMRVEEEIEVTSSSIESQMKTVTDAAENVREKVTDALGDAMDDVVERVQDVVEADLEEVGKAVEEVQAGGDIVEAVSNVTKAVAKVPADVGNVVAEDVAVVVDKLQDAVSGDDEEEADDSEKDDEKEENED
eukprot:CAMPEP_0113423802 /NCGR_PEP_ID=MMETSP0013_2-20120614/29237_1 /TAXON_ID=2843 ORGANISM="Skeletonema costatum, Strain 1716" /NCGR_SAMPLE_ID=MMETSP0013_2 /ASSEMBLY_ACC=CAM_ASM_000158 /LENGTH=496 /DNA_ID=CAMNT_0000311735 /DNA_START=62 /DNA_END=1552 /DNA_ORIENTATION=+ /assembly_acc=CAM_ASM_000158